MADISAIKLPNGTTYNLKDTTARNAANSAVPNTRTVNGKALSSDISLGAGDVGAYTKKETDTKINAAIASAYKYKGSVTADKLPTSGQVVGDVYNITNDSSYGKAGMNVAWTGTTWDALGSNVDLSNYVTTSDSRLSNARPASDVYAWAKAAKKPSYSASEIGAAPASHTHTKDQVGLGNVANLDQSKAIKSITRNGTTFTATALDGTTTTFTQQDTNTTYSIATSSADGLMSKTDKAKLDGIGAGSNVKSVNGKTGAVSLSKADIGLGNVDNTRDADKPFYKLGGYDHEIGNCKWNDAGKSLYKIRNFYAISGEGDYFYLAHKKHGYTITTTKHFSGVNNLFTSSLSADCYVRTDLCSEADPAILTIASDAAITATDVLTLLFIQHTGNPDPSRFNHWKLEILAAYDSSRNWPNATAKWKAGDWITVFERTNVSDIPNGLYCYLNPYRNNGVNWIYIKGIRLTIYAATPRSQKSGDFGYNAVPIGRLSLLDSRPSFSPAEALGALDVAGGTVYGKTTFQEGISATSYSGATATSSADGLMSKADKSKLDGIGAGSNVKSVNSKTGAVTLTKSDIGLSNVDNTADSAKSVKYATSAGSANSVAWGNVSGKPSTYTPSAHTHTSIESVQLTNQDLNDYKSNSVQFLYGAGSNTVANKPSGVDAFGVYTYRSAQGFYTQELVDTNGTKYLRICNSTSWTAWKTIVDSSNVAGYKVNNAGYADSAGKATNDSAGQNINTTYIKNLAVSGRTITYTKGNGATGTITTQDTNTTYDAFKGATSSANGGSGLVPGPTSAQVGMYLRGDGTWHSPSDVKVNNASNADNATNAATATYAKTAGSANSVAWGNVSDKPSTYPPSSHTHTKAQVGLGNVANLDQSKAIKSITRSGTTFTATALDGTKTTFTQQDNNTTYSVATSSTDGLMSKSDKAKLDGIGTGSNVKSVNGKTGAVTLAKGDVGLGSVANLDQSKAIKSITRSGTTFTATALDGTTTTFTQQDNNTTYGLASQSSNGLMSAADKKAIDREFFRMLPKGGTVIPNGANLNSTAYLKVGNYYQSAIANTTNMTNIPIKSAFMMYVLSPLSETYDNESTGQWVYRLRIFVEYTGSSIFTQNVYSGNTAGSFTYGSWVKMTNSNDLGAVSKLINDHIANKSNPHGVTKAQVGLGNVDNTADSAKSVKYATSAGNSSTVNGHTVNANVPSGAKFTDTTYGVATQSANGLMSAADKKKLDSYTTGSAGGAIEVTLAAASWSSSTTEINGNNYYTYSVSVANIGNQHPQIFCSGGDSVIPSATQESEFNHIRYALVDTAKSTVTFYSIEKPSVAINVVIKDYLESSIVSGTASVTIATSDWSSTTSTVNGRAFYTAKKTLSSVSSNYPTIICGTADTLPSDAEQTAFNCINYAAADTSTKTVTFYAIQKPTSAVVAIVI